MENSILWRKINIRVYDIITLHVLAYLIFRITCMLGGIEGVYHALSNLKLN
jgi:hypothetical protein